MRPFSDATRLEILGMSYHVEESHIKENEMKVRVDYYVVLKVSAIDFASVFDATEPLGELIVRRKYK